MEREKEKRLKEVISLLSVIKTRLPLLASHHLEALAEENDWIPIEIPGNGFAEPFDYESDAGPSKQGQEYIGQAHEMSGDFVNLDGSNGFGEDLGNGFDYDNDKPGADFLMDNQANTGPGVRVAFDLEAQVLEDRTESETDDVPEEEDIVELQWDQADSDREEENPALVAAELARWEERERFRIEYG